MSVRVHLCLLCAEPFEDDDRLAATEVDMFGAPMAMTVHRRCRRTELAVRHAARDRSTPEPAIAPCPSTRILRSV